MGFSFGGSGFGGNLGIGGGGIGAPQFDQEGNLVGFAPGLGGISITNLDLAGALAGEFGGFGGFVFNVPVMGVEVVGAPPTQEEINAAIEAEIEAERASEPSGVDTQEGNNRAAEIMLGLPFGSILGALTLTQLAQLSNLSGISQSSLAETFDVVPEREGPAPDPVLVPVPIPGEDRPCDPSECPRVPNLPIILSPVIQFLKRLSLQFPINVDIQRHLQHLLSFTAGGGDLTTALAPGDGVPLVSADACRLFEEVTPTCTCVCQSPVRSCCGSCAAGGECESG